MVVMLIQTLTQLGTTVVVRGGQTGLTGISFETKEHNPACLSDLRPMSPLSPRPDYPPADVSAPQADTTAQGAGRLRSRCLGCRGSASSARMTVPFGWSPSTAMNELAYAKPLAWAVRSNRGRTSACCLLTLRRVPPHQAITSGRMQTKSAWPMPTTGAFTASLRGKRAG
jgi:hypothetical protein